MLSGLQAMPHDAFVKLYERPRIPVVITGLQETWKAQELWNQTDLDKRFANHKFKVYLLTHPPAKSLSAVFYVFYVPTIHGQNRPSLKSLTLIQSPSNRQPLVKMASIHSLTA